MKLKRYTTGVTFFTTLDMYLDIKRISDEKEISLSEFLRNIVEKELQEMRVNGKKKSIK